MVQDHPNRTFFGPSSAIRTGSTFSPPFDHPKYGGTWTRAPWDWKITCTPEIVAQKTAGLKANVVHTPNAPCTIHTSDPSDLEAHQRGTWPRDFELQTSRKMTSSGP